MRLPPAIAISVLGLFALAFPGPVLAEEAVKPAAAPEAKAVKVAGFLDIQKAEGKVVKVCLIDTKTNVTYVLVLDEKTLKLVVDLADKQVEATGTVTVKDGKRMLAVEGMAEKK